MKSNKDIERVYELLERFDFNELSEQDKAHVLSIMLENEYADYRNTIKATGRFFSRAEDLIIGKSFTGSIINKAKTGNIFMTLLRKQIQIYKVAATILILIGIISVLNYSFPHNKNLISGSGDTVYIHSTDTVYSKLVDTVRVIKEKIIYISQDKDHEKTVKLLSSSKNVYDCSKEICPEDVDKIKDLAFNNNITRDTLIRD